MPTIANYFHLHLVSDSTGETLITVARAVAAQYANVTPVEQVYPLVRSGKQLDRVLDRLPVTREIVREYVHLIFAIRHSQRYETTQHLQKLIMSLEQYDRHLRTTRAHVRRYDLPPYPPGERRPSSMFDASFGDA